MTTRNSYTHFTWDDEESKKNYFRTIQRQILLDVWRSPYINPFQVFFNEYPVNSPTDGYQDESVNKYICAFHLSSVYNNGHFPILIWRDQKITGDELASLIQLVLLKLQEVGVMFCLFIAVDDDNIRKAYDILGIYDVDEPLYVLDDDEILFLIERNPSLPPSPTRFGYSLCREGRL